MTSSNGNSAAQAQAHFTGAYINDLRDLYIASMVSGLHSVSIGAPGWGKTDVAYSMLQDVFGDGNFGVVRIHPATAPEEIEGANDTEILLKESRLVKNVTGTPYDPRNKAVLVDEIGRCSKVLVGSLMFLMDRRDTFNPPPVLATSNFMPNSVESEALLDRIALWCHISTSPAELVPSDLVTAQLSGLGGRLHVKGTLPTMHDIGDVWEATPGPKSTEAVADRISKLCADAATGGLSPHPRRLAQWSRLLYRMSVYSTGYADFSSVPDDAASYLRFAWPAKTSEEQEAWRSISQTVDDIEVVIQEAYRHLFVDLRTLSLEVKAKTDRREYVNKGVIYAEWGVQVSKECTELNALALQPDRSSRDRERLLAARDVIEKWFEDAMAGKEIEEV